MTKRYELVNKYNPNELIQDNYNVMDGYVQIYGAETVEFELNDLFNRLKNIGEICDDCLQLENINEVGYIVGITEIKKIVENSIEDYTGYQVYIDENGKVQRYGKDNDETRGIE